MKLLNNLIVKIAGVLVLLLVVVFITFNKSDWKSSIFKALFYMVAGFMICWLFFCKGQSGTDCSKYNEIVKTETRTVYVTVDTCFVKTDTFDSKVTTVIRKSKPVRKKLLPPDTTSTKNEIVVEKQETIIDTVSEKKDTVVLKKYVNSASYLDNTVKLKDSIVVANGYIVSWSRDAIVDTLEKVSHSKVVKTIVVNPDVQVTSNSTSKIYTDNYFGVSGFTGFTGQNLDFDYGVGMSYTNQRMSLSLNKSLTNKGFVFNMSVPLFKR